MARHAIVSACELLAFIAFCAGTGGLVLAVGSML